MLVEFTAPRPFHAALEAEQYVAGFGLRVAPMEAGRPRAIGRRTPKHWSKLNEAALAALCGVMHGDMKRGPVVVWLDEERI